MNFILVLSAVLLSHNVLAKKPAMYHCQQLDGTVVIQDRRCSVTKLQQPKTVQTKPKVTGMKPTQSLLQKGVVTRSQINKGLGSQTINSTRSQYFSYGWDRFIPANWQLHKIKTSQYDQLLLSRKKFKGFSDFKEGVKLTVYADTMRKFRHGAFAQALKHYHQIRDNSHYKLLDSQFKSHLNFKVFNIKYRLKSGALALTEFYIDENHNDLFVLTVQSKESSWLSNWTFAEQLIRQL